MSLDETLRWAMERIDVLVADQRKKFEGDMQRIGADMGELYAFLEAREPEMLAQIEQQIRDQLIGRTRH